IGFHGLKDGRMKPQAQQTDAHIYSPERENRVAAALRENLRKRKSQQQAKQASAPQDIEDQ
ncbi:MAG TPA: hypothetical protein VFR09_01105, partial [Alphaproteobacteria bacterium]|nr:hypothetical protein [Alphaproteobacteria bacterium]